MLLGQNKKRAFQLPGQPDIADMPVTANQQPFVNNPSMAAQAAQLMPVDQPKPKFFGQGGTGRFIAGSIGDALQQWAGGQATFAQHRQMQQEAEQRAGMMQQKAAADQEAAQRDRAAKWENWQRQYDYERGNPKASAPYRWESNDGSLMEIGADNQPRAVYKDPTPKIGWQRADNGDGTFTMVPVPMTLGTQATQATQAPQSSPGVAPSGDFETTWRAAIQQESGGRPGVPGPKTQYGTAQGLTQMLPATAKSMAGKLGLPWVPSMMSGKTPEAADYQEKLGRAYFKEAWDAMGGDPTKALMYYHGGPNQKLWGSKTRQHAAAVLARMGRSKGATSKTIGGKQYYQINGKWYDNAEGK